MLPLAVTLGAYYTMPVWLAVSYPWLRERLHVPGMARPFGYPIHRSYV